jgi:hypothetical protein
MKSLPTARIDGIPVVFSLLHQRHLSAFAGIKNIVPFLIEKASTDLKI